MRLIELCLCPSSILGFLGAIGVNRLGVNDDLIMTAIETHERLGDEGL